MVISLLFTNIIPTSSTNLSSWLVVINMMLIIIINDNVLNLNKKVLQQQDLTFFSPPRSQLQLLPLLYSSVDISWISSDSGSVDPNIVSTNADAVLILQIVFPKTILSLTSIIIIIWYWFCSNKKFCLYILKANNKFHSSWSSKKDNVSSTFINYWKLRV